ncbi:hypothetical protein BDN70DRAFT_880472 [Pholiota conissans]|uniref:Uncharacterized protein n=1 Tax=Pholiota conissans TaxID=109636 RepID=A0A9P6CT44_9AGAR|nr:hypothetical protein BDN70DRAFT_880472 [Pholiota conissans]
MSSPPSSEVPFTPRKEFIKDQQTQPSSFALLALSGANCIRLYSFTPYAIASLNRLFERHRILSFREDPDQSLCEFALDGKPWTNPKSVPSEKLLVDIIATVYNCGYTYLSTIDYGREPDDRLVLTFSRPVLPSSNSRIPTPVQRLTPPKYDGSTSSLGVGLGDKPKPKRVPFALSFASVTIMRVISPPLHLTPAILQAVRGSWPRGVVSEQKVGDNSYEFKLKGYKWFQQDTFATDSLRHILSLLTSLDTHSFTLLTSLSLTNRSRVKDLWIFTGPASEEPSEHNIPEASQSAIRSAPATTGSFGELSHSPAGSNPHRRFATDPAPVVPHTPPTHHPRAATESPQQRPPLLTQPHVLRKPAPRAQIPVSVALDSDIPDEPSVLRVNLPSMISSGAENMTGIGSSRNLGYSHSPFDPNGGVPPITTASPKPQLGSPDDRGRPPLRSVSGRAKTPPLLVTSSAPSSPVKSTPPPDELRFVRPLTAGAESVPILQLLGADTFRDSDFSGNSEHSCEIPIKWSGPLKDQFQTESERPPPPRRNRVSSSGPQFPGGWQPSPIAEKSEDEITRRSPIEEKKVTTPIHEMLSRIESPEIVRPDMPLRKSEAALVGIIQATSPVPPVPQHQNSQRGPSTQGLGGAQGQGWVLVNVEGSATQTPIPTPATLEHTNILQSSVVGTAGLTPPYIHSGSHSSPRPQMGPPDNSPSPAAKAIAVIDAMESKHKKSRSAAVLREGGEGGSSSGVRRFFSLSRKNSVKASDNDDGKKRNAYDRNEDRKTGSNSIPRSNLRDRLRLIGTPEASRKEDKRRSID